ncbi:MAG: helix-turn-helix domain-containing protein [Streptosporangiaceae bacterium]|jgi:AcrR family transcriptional regulator
MGDQIADGPSATAILDADGENALTFRALAARLATGAGAIYWHVANKNDLLVAATDEVIAQVMTEVVRGAEPREAIRAIASGAFDAIDAHPWVGAQLSREPWQSAMLQIFESVGGPHGGSSSTRRSTRSFVRWRRSCPGTMTASNSWPASTSSWPASPPSDRRNGLACVQAGSRSGVENAALAPSQGHQENSNGG